MLKNITIILLLGLFISCKSTPIIKEKNFNHKRTIVIKYFDNTYDTTIIQSYGLPELLWNGSLRTDYTVNAIQVKRFYIIKDTIIEI